jgi:hypothetical protein
MRVLVSGEAVASRTLEHNQRTLIWRGAPALAARRRTQVLGGAA